MTQQQVLDAAVAFLHAVRHADEKALDAAYQVLASRANDSDYAADHEPYQGVCVAIQTEFRRRTL